MKIFLPAMACLAVVTTLLGAVGLMKFDAAPGAPGRAPAHWPAGSKIARLTDKPQIVVFAHPKCSCTGATLDELDRLSGVRIAIEFVRPVAESAQDESASFQRARRIPGATVSWDSGGVEAKRFGSVTSGTVILYSSGGNLLFQGGVTASRGHVGDNVGLASLARSVRTESAMRFSFPVFGCGL